MESLSLPVAFGESESLNPPTSAYAFGEWTSLSLRTAFDMQHYDCPLSAGDLDNSLSRLKYLKHLDVSSGGFVDVRTIPNSVGSLTRLTYLNLSNSGLSGTIPLHLGNLTNLQYLDLSSHGLTSYSLTWLSHLSSLRYIDLSGVNLTKAVDWPLVLHKLPVLSVLHLSDCGLANFPDAATLPTANVSLITTLDLSENDFSYSTKLDRLLLNLSSSLVNLDLFSTNLKGSTLESLGRLSHLEFLDLSENSLQEWTPGILGNLCNLQILRLRRSSLVGDLSGVLPRCMSSNLQEMDLSHNNITGDLPDWLGLVRNLSNLDLSYNLLNGSVPESLSQLTQLAALDLSFNSLHGVVSEAHFANMTSLGELALSGNALSFNISSTWVPPFQLSEIYLGSCRVGPRFPSWLQTQRALSFVNMSNAEIADVVPDWFWNATSGAGRLDISHNKLRGELPKSLTFCNPRGIYFQIIDLSSNQFHGRLPSICDTVGDISFRDNLFSGGVQTILNNSTDSMSTAILSQNFLSGDIPSSICNISLNILDLSQNSFTGELPICNDSNPPSYTVMNFAGNFLHGSIPRWIIEVGGLQVLRLNNNSFDGKIPTPLDTSPSDLVILDLGENKLMGNIPSWIGEKLSYLKFLRLRSNMLKGTIPPSLSNLTSLQVLDLAHNELSGTIPHSFKNLFAMAQTNRTTTNVIDFPDPVSDAVAIQYSTFEETVDVVVKGRTLEYTKTLSLVMVLDLSRNRLSGEIPTDLLDHLVGLQSLNLSNNQLTGKIPDKFGGMAQIEALDLSWNDFSGAIPGSIALLTSLSYLNLSHNNLSGRIPSGNQLQTLTDPSIYSGNLDLCGPPLSTKCPGDQPSKVPTPAAIADAEGNNNDDDNMLGLYLGMGIGYAVGLWGFFGVLLYKYSWRIAYFHFVDGITRKFSVAK